MEVETTGLGKCWFRTSERAPLFTWRPFRFGHVVLCMLVPRYTTFVKRKSVLLYERSAVMWAAMNRMNTMPIAMAATPVSRSVTISFIFVPSRA